MLNKFLVTMGIVASIFTLSGCQNTPISPVIPKADSTFETTGLGSTKVKAQHAAMQSAQKQCGHKTPVVISDKTTYNGVVDEKLGRVIDQGAAVLGTIIGVGKPSLSRDDDYEFFIKFNCQ
ncbi:MAG: hypothetical protein D8B60_07030 [Moraxella sp.]|jgi:hypothetical protein|nr:MAG: hypothetical protein D8B60_07030 [Moraxella sp.]